MNRTFSRLREIGFSFLNSRYLVAGSSLFFFIVVGSAFFLTYQNAGVMRDQIAGDFNRQQLSLAKQAVYQIEATLQDFELELLSLKRFVEADPGKIFISRAMKGLLDRGKAKGLMELAIMDRQSIGIKEAAFRGAGALVPSCRQTSQDRMLLGPLRVEEKETAGASVSDRTCTGPLADKTGAGPNSVPEALRSGTAGSLVTSAVCLKIAGPSAQGKLLFAKINVSGLVGALTRHIRSGKTGYAWVIDDKGTFLSHPEKDFIGKSALKARKEKKPYISFAQINSIMKDRMFQGEEGTGEYVSGWHRGIEGEMTKLIAFAPVKSPALCDNNAWSVAVAAPKSEVAGAVHRVYTRLFATGAAIVMGMFAFGLLVVIYQHQLSRTLQRKVEKTEADFHEMERIYERVVGQATDLIYILDLDMRLVLLNQQTVNVLEKLLAAGGPNREKAPDRADPRRQEFYLGRSFAELLEPKDSSFITSKISQVLKNQAGHSYEHAVDLEGRMTRLSTKLVPIRDDQGKISLILGISRDITEKFEMEQRIYQTEKLASIGTLASGVAHEINNPLGIILGFTDLLLEKSKPGSPEYEDLKTIESQASNAKRIVESLLGFARVTEGLQDSVDVRAALETVADIAGNTLMTKKIKLTMETPQSLPAIRGDSREFQQVIFNLINNSISAMEKEGGLLALKAWAEGGWVHISVKDNGHGIAENVKPRIFDPFFTTKKVGEGTGLGLSLCYGIVKKYGGKIAFTSFSKKDRPDKESSTTFTVSMPVQGGT